MDYKNNISSSFKSALRFFTYYFFNNTLGFVSGVSELLEKNYVKKMVKKPTNMEMMYAIFSNNIKVDSNGKVLNFDAAVKRASQFVATCVAKPKKPFVVEPEFEDWELELH